METRNIFVSHEVLKEHFIKYFHQSLVKYYSKYLIKVFGETAEMPIHLAYLCPLCLENYIVLRNDNPELSRVTSDFNLDHFPPESVGGKNKVLVCEPCNRDAGSAFDFILKEKLKQETFHRKIPNSKLELRAAIEGLKGNFKGHININTDANTEFSYNPNKKNEYLNNWNKTQESQKASITLLIKKFTEDENLKVTKAFLKSAYLYGFYLWGYDFVFSTNGGLIRKVLADELKYPLDLPTFWIDDIAHIPEGICFIEEPIQISTHIVNIPIISKELNYKAIASVILPAPEENGWEQLLNFATFLKDWEKLDIKLKKVPNLFNTTI